MDRDEEQRRRRGEHTRSYSQDRPIGSGENAKSILRGVKQWIPDIWGTFGDAGDALSYATRKVLRGQSPRTVASTGLGEKARLLTSGKSPLSQVQMTEIPETDWFEEGTRMLNPAMWNPRAAMKLGALGLASGVPGASLAIVKPKGGNWLLGPSNELEASIRSLMKGSQDNYRTLLAKGMIDEAAVQAKPEYALNKWLEGPLTRYLKRDLATEGDPVRKLLEGDRPVSHMRLDELMGSANEEWISQEALRNRKASGLPRSGVGQSGYGQAWETLSDAMVGSNPVEDIGRVYSDTVQAYPEMFDWIKRVPERTPIYDLAGDEAFDFLGLPHLRDELWNAVRQDSDLPQALRLLPEDFQQMGIEKAIRHVANINDWREAQKAQTNLEMLTGPGVKLVREYPENNPKGLRWVELSGEDPALSEALKKQLKYEGDTMGHCVGGYCDDVIGGRSRIFSLRDAKGEPHVTIETRPSEEYPEWTDLAQVKGKQNLAPKEDYLPFVQDFIRNSPVGEWGMTYDLPNTGLYHHGDITDAEKLEGLPMFFTQDELKAAREKAGLPWTPLDRDVKWDDYAEGGLVNPPEYFDNLDAFLGR